MSPLSPIRAGVPWSQGACNPFEPEHGEAPRQEAVYECAKGHVFPVPFAAGAEVPEVWEHVKCGSPARLEGTDVPIPDRTRRPAPGTGRYERYDDTSPQAQLRKRRSKAEGDAILAEALDRVKRTGAAR